MKEKGAKIILSGTRQNILNELSSELGGDTKAIAKDLTSKEKFQLDILLGDPEAGN